MNRKWICLLCSLLFILFLSACTAPEPEPVPEIEPEIETIAYHTLTLALVTASPLHSLLASEVAAFNYQNETYRIEILEFCELDIPKLQAEFATGQIPDIIFYADGWCVLRRHIPSHRLATRGLLADLYEFIDLDPSLGRDSFPAHILDAVSTGESLYELPYFFRLSVAVGDAARLGTEMGWTFDDMLRTLEETEFDGYLLNPNIVRYSLLHLMLESLIDDFVDWGTGTTYFDSDAFQRLLEIVKTYAPPLPYGLVFEADLIQQERQLMMWQSFAQPNFLQLFDFYFEQMVPIGFPAPYGTGHAIRYDASFSISALSEHKDVAWSFVRQFYMPAFFEDFFETHQFLAGIPIHMDGIELNISIENPGFTLGLGEHDSPDFYEIVVGYATAYDIERFRSILESVTRVARLDIDIWNIVSEEAEAFFQDNRTAEATAQIIQNKVQSFVSEQFQPE